MFRRYLPNLQHAITALKDRIPREPPVLTLAVPRSVISSTSSQHKENPGDPTTPDNGKSPPRDSSQVDKTTNIKKNKKEPSPLAEIRQFQKMSVEELKELIVSSGYELPNCTLHFCPNTWLTIIVIFQDTWTWPKGYNPEMNSWIEWRKKVKDRGRREQREQRKTGEQSEPKGFRNGGR